MAGVSPIMCDNTLPCPKIPQSQFSHHTDTSGTDLNPKSAQDNTRLCHPVSGFGISVRKISKFSRTDWGGILERAIRWRRTTRKHEKSMIPILEVLVSRSAIFAGAEQHEYQIKEYYFMYPPRWSMYIGWCVVKKGKTNIVTVSTKIWGIPLLGWWRVLHSRMWPP